MKLLGQGRGRQIARDQHMVGGQRTHPLEDRLEPLEPEPPRPAQQQLGHPNGRLLNKRTGLKAYRQTWMSERWMIRTRLCPTLYRR